MIGLKEKNISKSIRINGKKKSYRLEASLWQTLDHYAFCLGFTRDNLIERLEFYVELFKSENSNLAMTKESTELELKHMIYEMMYAEELAYPEELLERYKPINNHYNREEKKLSFNSALSIAQDIFRTNSIKNPKLSLNLMCPNFKISEDPLYKIYEFIKEKRINLPRWIKFYYFCFCELNNLISDDDYINFDNYSDSKKAKVLRRFLVKNNYLASEWSPNIFVQISLMSMNKRSFNFLSQKPIKVDKRKFATVNISLNDEIGGLVFYTLPLMCNRFSRSPSAMMKMVLLNVLFLVGVVDNENKLTENWEVTFMKNLP